MGVHVLVPLIFSFSLLLQRGLCEGVTEEQQLALLPPRGWNSYDSFDWVINEADFLQNAEIVSKSLLSYGYEYVVVDYLWYRRRVENAGLDSEGLDMIDEWGRLIPDAGRWNSSMGGNGFKEVAKKVHDLGLKFGIHVMRGISVQAYNANTPILDPIKIDGFGCGDSDTRPEIYVRSSDWEAPQISSLCPVRWNNTNPGSLLLYRQVPKSHTN